MPAAAMRFARTSLLILTGLAASSCEFIPGTDAHRQKKAELVAASGLIDPSSAQFRDVFVKGEAVCGEVNAKNRVGAYVGYSRFVVNTKSWNTVLDPGFDPMNLNSAEDLCFAMRGNTYSSSSATQSACMRADEQRLSQFLQISFDETWAETCGPITPRSVFQPSLMIAPDENPTASQDVDAALQVAEEALANAEAALGYPQENLGDPEEGVDVPDWDIESPSPGVDVSLDELAL